MEVQYLITGVILENNEKTDFGFKCFRECRKREVKMNVPLYNVTDVCWQVIFVQDMTLVRVGSTRS